MRAADAALAARGSSALGLLDQTERLWSGEPLPEDRYAAWSPAWRQELVDRYLAMLGEQGPATTTARSTALRSWRPARA